MSRRNYDHRQKMAYLTAAARCHRDPSRRVHLRELEEALPKCKDSIFSWMQWSDAKNFFHGGNDAGGVYYYLRPEFADAPQGEVYKEIHKFFNPNHDGE